MTEHHAASTRTPFTEWLSDTARLESLVPPGSNLNDLATDGVLRRHRTLSTRVVFGVRLQRPTIGQLAFELQSTVVVLGQVVRPG